MGIEQDEGPGGMWGVFMEMLGGGGFADDFDAAIGRMNREELEELVAMPETWTTPFEGEGNEAFCEWFSARLMESAIGRRVWGLVKEEFACGMTQFLYKGTSGEDARAQYYALHHGGQISKEQISTNHIIKYAELGHVRIVDVLTSMQFTNSIGKAKEHVRAGVVSINRVKVTDVQRVLVLTDFQASHEHAAITCGKGREFLGLNNKEETE